MALDYFFCKFSSSFGDMGIDEYIGCFDDELSSWAKEPHIMAAVNQMV